jgi:hypothetical protein
MATMVAVAVVAAVEAVVVAVLMASSCGVVADWGSS